MSSEVAAQILKAWDPFWKSVNTNSSSSGASTGSLGSGLVTATEGLSKASITQAKRYKRIVETNVGDRLRNVAGGIDQTNALLIGSIGNFSDTIKKNLEPISSFMGSTLGTLTGVVKDPLGTNGLGNVVTNLLNNVSPGFGDKVNGTISNLNLEAITNLPSQIFSSIDHLITAVDNLLAVPLSFLAEVYYGYIAIMQSISKLISNLMNAFIDLFFDFLDSIIPIKSILSLLDAVSGLANQIGGIAGTFLGANAITGFANQITNFSSQIGNVLNNPLNTIVSVLPTQVTSFINTLQNPQQFINDILPPQLSQAFATISKMTGFGFNGNMGFGFQSVLQGLQGGVVRSILSNYASQYSVLAPILGGKSNGLLGAGGNTAATSSYGFDTQLTAGRYSRGYVDESARLPASQYNSSSQNSSGSASSSASTGSTTANTTVAGTALAGSRTTTGSTNSVAGVTVGGGVQLPNSIFDLGS